MRKGEPDSHILVLNAGSSSLKFRCFRHASGDAAPVCGGEAAGLGTQPRLTFDGRTVGGEVRDHRSALSWMLECLGEHGLDPAAIAHAGHRIVHGGRDFDRPLRIGDDDIAALDKLRDLAPLHNGPALDVIGDLRERLPAMIHVACFDTAFHVHQPDVATRFALPDDLHAAGYRRFGFHGLNYEHVVETLPRIAGQRLPDRLLIFHLGNGSSLCAVRNGVSVATTMGYSTLDGLVMGTRCGSIDPGVLIALLRERRLTLEELEEMLYRKSGLLALSGVSSDMRTLLASDAPSCHAAIEHFCYWAARHAGSLVVALGGLDAVVFTGGIGENAAAIRARIIGHMSWLGLSIDGARNATDAAQCSPEGASPPIWIIPAAEDQVIARHVVAELRRDFCQDKPGA